METKEIYSTIQFARLLNSTKYYVRWLIRKKAIKAVKVNKRWQISITEIERFLNADEIVLWKREYDKTQHHVYKSSSHAY